MGSLGWRGSTFPAPQGKDRHLPAGWHLRELGGAVCKAPPEGGSYRTLDLPPFLVKVVRLGP
jgi:hypothetical protein